MGSLIYDTLFHTWTQSTSRLVRQLNDYAQVGIDLMWQRQIIFLGATALTALYFDPVISIFCFLLLQVSEAFDYMVSYRIRQWKEHDRTSAIIFLNLCMFGTMLSACSISFFSIMIAQQEGASTHFTPLFFLFASALFAAMNNHQLMPPLALRLTIYVVTFLYIPVRDLWYTGASLDSELWLQFFTILFVLYFIIDCSRIYFGLYRNGLNQLERITEEHQKTKIAFRAKSQFLSTVSHELRTPLTSVKSSLDLVNSGVLGPCPEKAQQVLRIAARNSNLLSELIDEILDLQRMEAGEMHYSFARLNAATLVADTATSNAPYFENLGVELVTIVPDRGVEIHGDRKRLQQVLTNILSNAAKHSPKGEQVVLKLERSSGKAVFSVTDRGPGIPDGMKDRVFDPFSQIDSSDNRKINGTGLGMSISKRIVESHGGTIDYASVVGEGTTFTVELDLAETARVQLRKVARYRAHIT